MVRPSNMSGKKSQVARARTKYGLKKRVAKKYVRGKHALRAYGASTKHKIVNGGLGAQTHSSCTGYKGIPSAVTKAVTLVGAKQRSRGTSIGQFLCDSGSQNVQQAFIAQSNALYNIMRLNPNLPGSVANLSGVSGENTIQRYVLHSASTEFLMANATSTPIEVIIYDIECKRDLYYAMNYVSPAGNVYTWDGTPYGAWFAGSQASSNAKPSTGYDAVSIFGAVPTESPIFNKYFKITKETVVQMPQGGIHRHKYHRDFARMMDASVYGDSNLRGIQGITHHTMFVIKGTPVNIAEVTEGATAIKNNPTTAQSLLQLTSTTEYVFTYSQVVAGGLFQSSVLPASNEVVQTDQINPGSGFNEYGQLAQIT